MQRTLCHCAWHMLSNTFGACPQHVPGYRWQEPQQRADSPTAGQPLNITGTLLWAPLSVLEGEPHTVSSMLEGLFLSVLSISCRGKLTGHGESSGNLVWWSILRRGALSRHELPEQKHVQRVLLPLVSGLHSLFWPVREPARRRAQGWWYAPTAKMSRQRKCSRSARMPARPFSDVRWLLQGNGTAKAGCCKG